jgi:PII-like signaling protein
VATAQEKKWLRLRIYIGESDRYHGKPLYLHIPHELKSRGVKGATVFRGIAGYGSHSLIHTADILRLSEDLPVVIEVVEEEEIIRKILPDIEKLVTEGLITLEPVYVVYYGHSRKH